jgi:pyruvate/2-oxoglutarate dehydrogenase complex dihydrolipoamide acyltransferase (E2) component
MTIRPPRGATLLPYSRAKQVARDLSVIQRRHVIHALLEVDVTHARALLRTHQQECGESLSFTAYVMWCIARTVGEYPEMHAYRYGRKRLIIFPDVDVNTLLERRSPHERRVVSHIVRSAQRKSVREIHDEIRGAQRVYAGYRPYPRAVRLYDSLPHPVRRFLVWGAARNPVLWRRVGGTVVVTAVGMFGKGGGWGIPTLWNTLVVTVGGIGAKPGMGNGQVTEREYLNLTISADHDVVDGAAMAAFASSLRELIESAKGLNWLRPVRPGEAEHDASTELPAPSEAQT